MAQDLNAFMVSQASKIIGRIEEQVYEGIHYDRLSPIESGGDPLVPSVEYFGLDGTGDAGMTHYSAADLPTVEPSYQHYLVKCRTFANQFMINEQAARVASSAGRDLSADAGKQARRILEEQLDDVFWHGNSDLGWDGFHQVAGVTKGDQTATLDIALKTEDGVRQLIDDVNRQISGIYEDTKGMYLPDTMVVPHSVYTRIQSVQMANLSTTLFEWLQRSTEYSSRTGGQRLTITSADNLRAEAGNALSGNGAGKNRWVIYRKDPEVLRFHLPMPVTPYPPYMKPNRRVLVTELWANCGGLEILRPKGVRYLDEA